MILFCFVWNLISGRLPGKAEIQRYGGEQGIGWQVLAIAHSQLGDSDGTESAHVTAALLQAIHGFVTGVCAAAPHSEQHAWRALLAHVGQGVKWFQSAAMRLLNLAQRNILGLDGACGGYRFAVDLVQCQRHMASPRAFQFVTLRPMHRRD